jgi:hypothetical protein
LVDAANNYGEVLLLMGESSDQVHARINQISEPYGIRWP